MIKSTLVGIIIFVVLVLGYFWYSGYDLGVKPQPSNFCETDSDCAPINCIRAPCPKNICSDNRCVIVLPRDEVCKGDAECFYGKVTNVIDGDTLYVDDYSVRLALIDTPEYGETGYAAARHFVESVCPVGTEVLVDEDDGQTTGSYGRIIAEVYCGTTSLNQALLDNGHAVITYIYCDRSEFAGERWAQELGC